MASVLPVIISSYTFLVRCIPSLRSRAAGANTTEKSAVGGGPSVDRVRRRAVSRGAATPAVLLPALEGWSGCGPPASGPAADRRVVTSSRRAAQKKHRPTLARGSRVQAATLSRWCSREKLAGLGHNTGRGRTRSSCRNAAPRRCSVAPHATGGRALCHPSGSAQLRARARSGAAGSCGLGGTTALAKLAARDRLLGGEGRVQLHERIAA